MTTDPAVSVVMIFLNAEDFIEEAIDSVVGQTFSNWELLLVDDGSTDGSSEIARRYGELDSERICYLTHPSRENRGMSASRNLGLSHARGEFIAFLDADDVWEREKLEEQVAVLETYPDVGMTYGNTLYWHSWKGQDAGGSRDVLPKIGVTTETVHSPPVLLAQFVERTAAVPCMCSLLVRRECVSQVGGFEQSFRGLFEDQVFYSKIASHYPIYVSRQWRDRYRQHPASACAAASSRTHHEARLDFLRWLEDYAHGHGVDDAALMRALRRQVWVSRHNDPTTQRKGSDFTSRILLWMKEALLRFERRLLPRFVSDWIWTRT